MTVFFGILGPMSFALMIVTAYWATAAIMSISIPETLARVGATAPMRRMSGK